MSVTYTFSPNTKIKSAEVNQNFTDITSVPDNIDWAWSSFSPTWTGLTLGNGTSEGSYIQFGKTVIFRGRLTCGSTTNTTGTGSPIRSDLPVIGAELDAHGAALLSDASAGNLSTATALQTSSTAINFYSGLDVTQAVAGGFPTGYFTAGAGNSTGDILSFTITYEAA